MGEREQPVLSPGQAQGVPGLGVIGEIRHVHDQLAAQPAALGLLGLAAAAGEGDEKSQDDETRIRHGDSGASSRPYLRKRWPR